MRMHRSLSALAILCAAATAWAPRIATAQTGPTTPNAPWSPPVTPALNQPAPPGYAPPSYAPLRPDAATARPLIPMPQSQWPAEDPSDSKLAAGIALFALSGLTLAHGGVLLAESPPTGCQSYDVYGPSSNCDDQGMGVAGVHHGGALGEAGVEDGWHIRAVGGVPVATMLELEEALHEAVVK